MLFRATLYLRMAFVSALLASIYIAVGAFAYYMGVPVWVIASVTLSLLVAQYTLGVRNTLSRSQADELDRDTFGRLYAMSDHLAEDMGVSPPTLYAAPMPGPSAFAIGRPGSGHIVASPELLNQLPEDEVRAIFAHEMAHLRNRDAIVMVFANSAAELVGLAADFVIQFTHGGRVRRGGVAATAHRISTAVAWIFVFALSRHREYIADRDAAEALGSGKPMADALARLHGLAPVEREHSPVEALCVLGSSGSLFDTHPPVEKRIARLSDSAEE